MQYSPCFHTSQEISRMPANHRGTKSVESPLAQKQPQLVGFMKITAIWQINPFTYLFLTL